jgi:hypothetical protein
VPEAPSLKSAAPQLKPLKEVGVGVAMLFPGVPAVRALTVTTLLLEVAEAPVLASRLVLSLMAVAMFVASCVVLTGALTDQ